VHDAFSGLAFGWRILHGLAEDVFGLVAAFWQATMRLSLASWGNWGRRTWSLDLLEDLFGVTDGVLEGAWGHAATGTVIGARMS